jgi:hypothetical protein
LKNIVIEKYKGENNFPRETNFEDKYSIDLKIIKDISKLKFKLIYKDKFKKN